MRVGLTMQLDNVLLTELALRDGSWSAVGQMQVVQPGQRVGHVPYERLQAMGDGEHDLLDEGPLTPCEQSHSDSLFAAGGWFFFAAVAVVCSPLVYSFFDDWETHGGRIRIHWFVGMIYGLGGKVTVAAFFGLAALVLAGMGVRSFLLTGSRWRNKLAQLEAALTSLRARDGEGRMMVFNPATGHALWIVWRDGTFHIALPEEYLTPKQARKAAAMLGPSTTSEVNHPSHAASSASTWYGGDVGDHPGHAALDAARKFHKIFGLHPSCEIRWETSDVPREVIRTSMTSTTSW